MYLKKLNEQAEKEQATAFTERLAEQRRNRSGLTLPTAETQARETADQARNTQASSMADLVSAARMAGTPQYTKQAGVAADERMRGAMTTYLQAMGDADAAERNYSQIYYGNRKAETEAKTAAARTSPEFLEKSRGDEETAGQAYGKWFGLNKNYNIYNTIYNRKSAFDEQRLNELGHATVGQDLEKQKRDPYYGVKEPLLYITDQEAETYFYIWNTEGPKQATAYIDSITPELNARREQDRQAANAAYATENPVAASADTVLQNQFSILGAADLAGQNVRRYLGDEKPVDYNSPMLQFGKNTQEIRGKVAENLAEEHPAEVAGVNVASFLYQTGMSMADSGVQLVLNRIGIPEPITLTMMSGGAAQQSVLDAKERGITDGQALLTGIAAGTAEYIFEKISLDHFVDSFLENTGRSIGMNATASWGKPWAKKIASALIDMGVQGLTEGSEEAFTTIANTITDNLINGDLSQFRQNIAEYENSINPATGENFTRKEATTAAAQKWFRELISDALGGFISGFGMGAGGAVYRGISPSAQYQAARTEYDTLQAKAEEALDKAGHPRPDIEAERTKMEKLRMPTAETQTAAQERAADPLVFALNKAANGETVSNADAKAILDNPQAMQALRDSGVLTDEGATASEQRNAVKSAVQAMAERQAAQEERQAREDTSPAQEEAPRTEASGLRLPTVETNAETQTVENETQRRLTLPAAETPTEVQTAESTTKAAETETQAPKAGRKQTTIAQQRQRQMADATATTAKGAGFETGDAEAPVYVRSEEMWDADEKQVAQALRESGIEPVFVTGLMKDADGNRVLFLREGDKLALQADNRNTTLQQIAEQALGARLDINGSGLAEAAAGVIRKRMENAEKPSSKAESKKAGTRGEAARQSAVEAGASEADANTAARLADLLGKDIRFFRDEARSGSVINGYTENGVIYVNAAVNKRPVVWVVAHELTHNTEHAQAYKGLQKLAKQYYEYNGDKWDARINARVDMSRRIAADRGDWSIALDPQEAARELVADYVAEALLTNEDAIRQAVQYDAPTVRRVLTYLKSVLAKLGGKEPNLEWGIDRISTALKETAQAAVEKKLTLPRENSTESKEMESGVDNPLLESQQEGKLRLPIVEGTEKQTSGLKLPTESGEKEAAVETEEKQAKYSIEKDHAAYRGKSLTEDQELYDYDFLVARSPMIVQELPPLSAAKVNGEIDADYVGRVGMERAGEIGRPITDNVVGIRNRYTDIEIHLSKDALVHGVGGENKGRTRTNARLALLGGDIVQNAIPVNALHPMRQAKGTYAMAALLGSGDRAIVAIVHVDQYMNATSFEFDHVAHSVNGRLTKQKIEDIRSSTRETPSMGATDAFDTITIADFLSIVNETHQSILSDDVLEHYGETRNPTGHYNGRVKYSAEMDEDYLAAVDAGDMETAQRMVDEAAEKAMPDSVVRNKKGKLQAVYHGTKRQFYTFKKGDIGYHFGNKSTATTRVGRGKDSKFIKAYLNITNPIEFDEDFGSWDADYRITQELVERGVLSKEEYRRVRVTDSGKYRRSTEAANLELVKVLKEKGYDGIVYKNYFESTGSNSYIAFDSSQIKSADPVTYDDNGNVIPLSERFNPEQEDIRYSAELDEDVAPVHQAHTSRGTSINTKKLPVLYSKAIFESGTTNIDIGAGVEDTPATAYLESIGVESLPFDPFNRSMETNKRVTDFLQSGRKADTATCSNVLNVVDNAEARANIILEMAKAIKPDGTAYFTVYSNKQNLEAGKAGEVKAKPDQWQEFREAKTYVDEIRKYFDDVKISGGLISARQPKKNLPKAVWQIASTEYTDRAGNKPYSKDITVRYSAESAGDLNPEPGEGYNPDMDDYDREQLNKRLDALYKEYAAAVNAPQGLDPASVYRTFANDESAIKRMGGNAGKAAEIAERIRNTVELYSTIPNESAGDWAIRQYRKAYPDREEMLRWIRRITEADAETQKAWEGEWTSKAALNRYLKAVEQTDFRDLDSIRRMYEEQAAALRTEGEDLIVLGSAYQGGRESERDELQANRLRNQIRGLEEYLDYADLNETEESKRRKARNELVKLRHDLDQLIAKERRLARKTSINDILNNLDKYRRADLESLAEQVSDSAWDDYEDLSDEELRNELRTVMEERAEDYTELERQVPKYGFAVRPVEGNAIQYSAESEGEETGRKLLGTTALDRTGVKVSGSVGRYGMTESLLAKDKAAKSLARETRKAEKRLNATAKEKEFANGIAAGVYSEDDIPASMNRKTVLELADYYWAQNSANLDTLHQLRATINKGLQDEAKTLLEDADIKPQSMLKLNERTPERSFRAMFGDKAEAITKWLLDPVRENEAEKIRWYNKQMDAVRTFTDGRGKNRRLTKEERALTMRYMEGRAAADMVAGMEAEAAIRNAASNIKNGEAAGDAAKEFGLTYSERDLAEKLAGWMQTKEDLKKADSKIVENAAKKYAELFDMYYAAINDFLVAHGYEPIGYIKGYAPHMQPEENQNLLNRAFKALGINTEVMELPASIAGQTAFFKPNKRWNPYFLQRNGAKADYDIERAYQSYVDYMSDVLFHTDDIMRTRQMSNWIRKTYTPEEISQQLDQIQELTGAPTEDKLQLLRDAGEITNGTILSPVDTQVAMQKYADRLYEQAAKTTQHSNLVMWLDNYANILAGKQSFADRGWEYSTGRKSLNWANRLSNAFQKANVAGNLSSVLNQTAQLPMIYAELGERDFTKALLDMVSGKTKAWAADSDFLTAKAGKEMLYTDNADKFISALFAPSGFTDALVSTVAVRGAYNKYIRQGMSHEEAMRKADDFGEKVMGSRARGSRPLAYESKGFFSKMIHMFQVEAVNSWDHIATDLPYEIRKIAKTQGKPKAAAALAALILRALMGAFVLNRLTDELYGGTPAPFDILGLTATFLASGKGLSTNGYIRTIMDNVLEKNGMGRIFGTEPMTKEDFDLDAAAEELVYNVMNDIPLVRNVAGVLGLGDQTVPLPGVDRGELKAMWEAAKGMLKDGVDPKDVENLLRAGLQTASNLIPGGRQIRKTTEGAEAAIRGGSYKNGKLQYPVQGAADITKALLFGKNATNAAKDYWATGGNALTVKQTELHSAMAAAGMDRKEAYDAIQRYRKIENDKSLTSLERGREERALISDLDVSDEAKLEMYRSLTGADTRTDKFRAIMNRGLSFDRLMTVYDKYAEIDSDDDKKATEKAKEFSLWVDKQKYTEKQKTEIKDQLKYYSHVPAEAERYEDLTSRGLKPDSAAAVDRAISNLTPLKGNSGVTDAQKWNTGLKALGKSAGTKDKLAVVGSIVGTNMYTDSGEPSRWNKINRVVDSGETVEDTMKMIENGTFDTYIRWMDSDAHDADVKSQVYIEFRAATKGMTGDKDASGKTISGSLKNKVVAYIDSLNLTADQKDVLLTDYNSSYSHKDVTWHNGSHGGGSSGGRNAPASFSRTLKLPTVEGEPAQTRSRLRLPTE